MSDTTKDHPISGVRRDPVRVLVRDQHSAFGVPDVRAGRKTRVQQDGTITILCRLAEKLASRVRHWGTVPLCLSLRVQVGGGPLRSLAHGLFVGSVPRLSVCLASPDVLSYKALVSDRHGYLVPDCHSTAVQQAFSPL